MARYLEAVHGYSYIRYSQVLAAMLEARGLPVTRRTLQEVGLDIFRQMDGKGLTALLLGEVGMPESLVVDGIRHVSDVTGLRDYRRSSGLLVVYVDADEALRRLRYHVDVEDGISFEAASAHPVESEVPLLSSVSDIVIANNDSLHSLYSSIERILASEL